MNGRERWRVSVEETFEPVGCGALVCTAEQSLNGDQRVVARDPATGEERWSSSGITDGVLSNDTHRVDLLLGRDPALRSVDPATGTERWTLRLEEAFGFEAGTAGGWDWNQYGEDLIGYVGVNESADPPTRGAVIAVDLARGTPRWVRADLHTCLPPLVKVLLLCGYRQGVERVDPTTGTTTWKVDLPILPNDGDPDAVAMSGFSADEGTFLLPGEDGWRAIDTATGTVTAPEAGSVAWMRRYAFLEVSDGPAGTYAHSFEPVPYDPVGRKAVDDPEIPAAEVPPRVGTTAGGMRIYLDGAHRVHAVPL